MSTYSKIHYTNCYREKISDRDIKNSEEIRIEKTSNSINTICSIYINS